MIKLPDTIAVRKFRQFLDAHNYSSTGLTERLGRARPPAPGEQQQMFDDSRIITTENVLIRLFLLGSPVDEATAQEFLPESIPIGTITVVPSSIEAISNPIADAFTTLAQRAPNTTDKRTSSSRMRRSSATSHAAQRRLRSS